MQVACLLPCSLPGSDAFLHLLASKAVQLSESYKVSQIACTAQWVYVTFMGTTSQALLSTNIFVAK